MQYGKHWPKADLTEMSELYDKSLLNSSVKNSIIFTVFVCNELNSSFECTIVFCFGIVPPCCWYNCLCIWKIDVVDETGSRLISQGQHRKFQIEWMFRFGSRKFEVLTGDDYRWWDCKFHDPCKPHLGCPKRSYYYYFLAFLLDFSSFSKWCWKVGRHRLIYYSNV